MSIPQVPLFELGEIINPEDWDLRIQITALEPLEAVIIKSVPTSEYVRSWVKRFFPVGKVLRFTRAFPEAITSWRVDTDEPEMPWFMLSIYEGRKRFEHYR